ncbi:MAG: ABC transporter ATP-binding protein [Bacteroidetes bacterium]|nr:MAG: ABC transporter ATP-binding protein [Bacteroidota bacterium]
MNYFQAENLSKSYAEKLLFENISFGIDQGQKVGFIARNGAGKTTLLNIMMKLDIPDAGQCTFRNDISVSYLNQNPEFSPGHTVIETLLHGDNILTQTLRQYEEEVLFHEKNPEVTDNSKLQVLITKMDELDAWNHEVKIRQIISKLKIEDLNQPVETLSGGQTKRVALARILIDEADFIILDEPTNHLDLEMIEWLEDYLARQKLTLLMVTHDRYFLDNVCNEILELDQGKMYRYKGNYAYFLGKKQERENTMLAETEKARNLLRKETEWMRRQPKARTTKSKARIESYHQLKEAAILKTIDQPNEILMQSARLGKKILELHNIRKSFDDKLVIEDFSYVFKKREKVGIVGMNGTGKSTLLNIITRNLTPDRGTVTTGETIQFGYYHQDGLKIDENKKVIDVIKDIAESIRVGKDTWFSAAQFLHYFNFPYNTQNDFVRKLSGGEKRRLFLITILMKNPNFLILDEPTNDLDIATLNVLEDFLADFGGCLIVVSHDRYFLDKLVDHIFVFEGNGKIKDFPGNYTDYQLKKSQEKKQDKKEDKPQQSKPAASARPAEKKKLTYKEQKEFEALEAEIPILEKEKAEALEQMNSGSLTTEKFQEISELYARLEKELEEKEFRWLELSEWL